MSAALFFTSTTHQDVEETIACLNGLLIFEAGEADLSYLFRCQERYLFYTSLLQMRSLFFVKNEGHWRRYLQKLNDLKAEFQNIQAVQGLWKSTSIPTPLFIELDSKNLKLSKLVKQKIDLPSPLKIQTNQVAPTFFKFLRDLKNILEKEAVHLYIDNTSMEEKIMTFNDKANYVKLIARSRKKLPPHVPTIVIEPLQLLKVQSWEAFVTLLGKSADKIIKSDICYIKSSQDSGGNGAIKIRKEHFTEQLKSYKRLIYNHIISTNVCEESRYEEMRTVLDDAATLKNDWSENDVHHYVADWISRRIKISTQLLVQAEVHPPKKSDLPFGIGVSCFIHSNDNVEVITVAGQVYLDAQRTIHLGAHLSDKLMETILTASMRQQVTALCKCFAEEGYIGPISFDACLDKDETYQFIYDCNPRLTAIFPALAVKTSLEKEGYTITNIVNIDYRGRFKYADFQMQLSTLNDMQLLFTPDNQSGIILLPNLARDNGYDALFINKTIEEINQILATTILGDGSDVDKGRLTKLYY